MAPYINTFKRFYSQKYGRLVGKIALDPGTVCPNRLKGGCIYCSAQSFKPFYLETGDSISTQIKKGRAFLEKKGFDRYFAYFQQETTTAVPIRELSEKFAEAVSEAGCLGLIISTRPDYVERDWLKTLESLAAGRGIEILVEVGLQSANNATLAFLNRNHTYNDFSEAVEKIRECDFITLGVHLILGLPGEGYGDMLETVNKVCELGIDYIKFHHLQVIRDTKLHEIYSQEPFRLYTSREYLQILAQLLANIPRRVVMHRLWSTADPSLLIEPRWNLPSYELSVLLHEIMEEHSLFQGKNVSI